MGGQVPIAAEGTKKRKADSTPPEGYVCRLCSTPGHWIQVCPTKKTGSKRTKKPTDHVPVPGQDPSPEDIERAKELQAIPPPKCFCGDPSRLNKVKRSKAGGDDSRAIGKYFFFCSKKRDDDTQCRFARPVEMEMKKQKKVADRQKKTKEGEAKKKTEKLPPKEKNVICKFFAKSGTCKKGTNCEFSHDTKAKKAPEKAPEEKKIVSQKQKEEEDTSSSSDDSSTDDSSSSDSDDSSSSGDDSD